MSKGNSFKKGPSVRNWRGTVIPPLTLLIYEPDNIIVKRRGIDSISNGNDVRVVLRSIARKDEFESLPEAHFKLYFGLLFPLLNA